MYDEKKPPSSERDLPIHGRPGIEPLLDSHKAAAMLDVHPRTLQRMVQRGLIAAFRWANYGVSGHLPLMPGSTTNRLAERLTVGLKCPILLEIYTPIDYPRAQPLVP